MVESEESYNREMGEWFRTWRIRESEKSFSKIHILLFSDLAIIALFWESNVLNASQHGRIYLSCLASYIYFVTQLCKGKKLGNVTMKNYLNESLLSLLSFIIYGQGSFEKGLM